MNDINVKSLNKNYKIIFQDSSLTCLQTILQQEFNDKSHNFKKLLIIDENVYYCNKKKVDLLTKDNNIFKFLITSGGESKNLNTINNLYDYLINNDFRKTDVIIGLGGGVVGDISGFVAATYYRGMKFLIIPTTLLSQVDSSIGGKNAVHSQSITNAIGTIYPPDLVIIDSYFLDTLDDIQLSCGYAEIIKIAHLHDQQFLSFLQEDSYKNMSTINYIINQSIVLKKRIVEVDEQEKNIRKSLNYGHTLGHALESTLGHENLLHGHAVAIGCLYELFVAVLLKKNSEQEFNRMKNIFFNYNLDQLSNLRNMLKNNHTIEEITQKMTKDKKNVSSKIFLIIPSYSGYEYMKFDSNSGFIENSLKNFIELEGKI